MRKVALLVVTSFGLAGCADSIFSPDLSRRTDPVISSLSSIQPAPYASERQERCTGSRTWLTC
jgi:hypothetical protein